MANVFYPNFPIPTATNVIQPIWKLTRAMKKAGWNVVAHSDGTTKTAAGTNANDSWGSNADPSSDTYPSAFDTAKAPWIVMSGPVTLKISLGIIPTGTFLRGETITQAVSAAEGELLGSVWSVADGYGWAVVLPRVGTFNNSNTVTGSSSGATFVPTGTIQTYNREIMIGKTTANNTFNGQVWHVCCDGYAESTSLFSYLATQTGCTATVPPGAGGTGNSFPTFGNAGTPTGGAIAIRGTSGSTTEAAFFGSVDGFVGNSQIACVNATPSTGVSADGSFYLAMINTSWDTTTFHGWAYQRVDDGDPGDVDPYVWISPTFLGPTNWVRTANSSVGTYRGNLSAINFLTTGNPSMFGYSARGVTVNSNVRDIAAPFSAAASASTGSNLFSLTNNVSAVKLLNHPSVSSPPIVREKILVYCPGTITNGFHHFKGRLRWMFFTSVGSKLQTSDTNTFLCLSTNATTTPALWIGPYDGSSTPT